MSADDLDQIFRALSDRTRRAILERLTVGELTVTEVATPFGISLAAISKHLTILERAGLVQRERAGTYQVCSLKTSTLGLLRQWSDRLPAST